MANEINGVTLSASNTTVVVVVPLEKKATLALYEKWTGDLEATIGVEFTGSPDPHNPDQTVSRWGAPTNLDFLAWLANTPADSPSGGKPGGSAGVASIQTPIAASAARFTVTRTAGAGAFWLDSATS